MCPSGRWHCPFKGLLDGPCCRRGRRQPPVPCSSSGKNAGGEGEVPAHMRLVGDIGLEPTTPTMSR